MDNLVLKQHPMQDYFKPLEEQRAFGKNVTIAELAGIINTIDFALPKYTYRCRVGPSPTPITSRN